MLAGTSNAAVWAGKEAGGLTPSAWRRLARRSGRSSSGGIELDGQFVDVIATTKGKGFQGVVRRYKFGGGPVGLNTLAAALSEEQATIEEVHEPYLLQLGLLERTPRGRTATQKAYGHLKIKGGGRLIYLSANKKICQDIINFQK